MGWIVSFGLIVSYIFVKNDTLLIASGIFAISGAISEVAVQIKKSKE